MSRVPSTEDMIHSVWKALEYRSERSTKTDIDLARKVHSGRTVDDG